MTENILKRMNGTIGGGHYRTAKDAYNNIFIHLDGFSLYPANAYLTLSPAIKTTYPSQNENSVQLQGTGYIEFDTWIHTTQENAENVVTWSATGNGTITNVRWEDYDATHHKAHKISFDWNGAGQYNIRVPANSIISTLGGTSGHQLDGNNVTPNGDDFLLTFTTINSPDYVDFYAD